MSKIPVYGIEVFLTIVREGSLRAAAKALGIGAPAVSLQLKALEESMGVDLLHRTTRSIGLTEAGKVLFDSAAPAYRDLLDATKKTREIGTSLSGTLRLALSPEAYSEAIDPVLDAFLTDNPRINLDMSFREGPVDIVREGFHAGIRPRDVLSPDMIALRLTPPLETAFFASPAYLHQNGQPDHPEDLFRHQCIRFRPPNSGKHSDWIFDEDGDAKRIDPPARLTFDSTRGVIEAACLGRGIGWCLASAIDQDLRAGDLKLILEPYTRKLSPFNLYYRQQNKRVECLRLLIVCFTSHGSPRTL